MALAAIGNPNWVLVTVVFQLVKVAWLRRFVESIRKSRLNRSFNRKVRPMELFKVNWPGPMIESLPALPHWPARGAV
jgi:hypothetical protein